jgi:hypothetical protein
MALPLRVGLLWAGGEARAGATFSLARGPAGFSSRGQPLRRALPVRVDLPRPHRFVGYRDSLPPCPRLPAAVRELRS